MMRIAGHTMGTPEYTLPEAIRFFSSIGLDGIEIIVQTDGYKCAIDLNEDASEIEKVKELLKNYKLDVACLTPYLNLFNSLNEKERKQECERLQKVILIAEALNAPNIRVYGGKFIHGDKDQDGLKAAQLIKSMRECGDFAREHNNVKLCIENHFGTMTTTASKTAEIVNIIDHPNVGILYDQANLAFFPAEEFEEAIQIQKHKIFHVHVKDLVYKNDAGQFICSEVTHIKESERTVSSRIPGEGILSWPLILQSLKKSGYNGWLSLEYERRWQTIDLPPATEGMPRALHYIRRIIEHLK